MYFISYTWPYSFMRNGNNCEKKSKKNKKTQILRVKARVFLVMVES